MEAVIIVLLATVLTVAAGWPFVRRRQRLEDRARQASAEAERYGLHVPASLHPVVDPARCSGCAACVAVCPEGDVLGLLDGQAVALQPARCVGHGMCQRACPTDAITLVFGTAERGVELPLISEHYETNVPGLYIVGELGGMGLVRNAFEQGRQCVEAIAAAGPCKTAGAVDLVIVGCGPAGLSAALTAAKRGLMAVVLEKEASLGGAVRSYPRRKLVMTQPFEVPGYGRLAAGELPKERLVEALERAATTAGLEARTGETVRAVRPLAEGGGFEVVSDQGSYRACRVILAIGRRGVPRKLGVPGEDGGNVYYSLAEPEAFAGARVVVVGGGDAAVEAALMLSDQPGTTVRLSYRRDALSRVKPRNLERFEAAVESGAIEPLWSTTLAAIGPEDVAVEDASGARHLLPNDEVFVFAGGELPSAFLEACGIRMDTYFGHPR